MTGGPNEQRLAMLQDSRGDSGEGVGVTEIDSHIAIFHGRLDRIAKIALPDDVDLRVGIRKIAYGFSHAPSGADEQRAHRRRFHLKENPHPTLSLGKGAAAVRYRLKRLCPPLPLRKRIGLRGGGRGSKSFPPLKIPSAARAS